VTDTDYARTGAYFVAAQQGDRAALDVLVRELTPLLWQVARAQGLDRDSSADVVQTVVDGRRPVARPMPDIASYRGLLVATGLLGGRPDTEHAGGQHRPNPRPMPCQATQGPGNRPRGRLAVILSALV
jgi:hypothetical protein